MGKYKFTKFEDKYTWSNDIIKIQFSDPSIQGHNDYVPLEDEKGIMYYYYTVKIFKNNNGWKLVSKRSTDDFPKILQLKWMLNNVLYDLNPVLNGQKHEYISGDIKYSSTLCTEGFSCDDFYEITKYADNNNENPNYILYLGCTFNNEGDLNSVGIRTPYIETSDLKALLDCVNGFINYSISEYNHDIKISNKEIKDGKIYEYNSDGIEHIFVVGDIGDFIILSKSGDNMITKEYKNVKIVDIIDNKILLSNNINIDICSLAYIFVEPSIEKLSYGINEITNDFIGILSNKEMKEFNSLNIEKLFKKYNNAIINRTWMCREEHKFNNINETVKKIIKNIKEKGVVENGKTL